MKKKNLSSEFEAPVVDVELITQPSKTIFAPKVRKTFRCKVCDEPGASEESEGLCWVCRRLKISAWREVEVQMPMSE